MGDSVHGVSAKWALPVCVWVDKNALKHSVSLCWAGLLTGRCVGRSTALLRTSARVSIECAVFFSWVLLTAVVLRSRVFRHRIWQWPRHVAELCSPRRLPRTLSSGFIGAESVGQIWGVIAGLFCNCG